MTKINNRPERSIKRRGGNAPTTSGAELGVTDDQKSTELDFFELIASFSPDDWQGGLKSYIYRLAPIIDRKDGQHYLAKVSESFDQDYLLRHWGSGKYHLKLNDARGMTIATTTISCHNPDFPPRVDPSEVVASDPRNEGYFKTWGKKTDAVAGENKSSDSPAILQAVMEFSDITKRLLDSRSNLNETQIEMLRGAHDEAMKLVSEQARTDLQGNSPGQLLDVRGRQVCVALAKPLHKLDEPVHGPLRHAHSDHRPPCGLERHVNVVDLLAERLRKSGRYVVERYGGRSGQDIRFAVVTVGCEDFERYFRDIPQVDHPQPPVLEWHVQDAV